MAKVSVIDRLTHLIQIDIDAVRAYEQAITAIDEVPIRAQLTAFKGDHQRHIAQLSEALRKLGATPPPDAPGVPRFLIAGFTAITAAMGTMAALMAMRGNEALTNAAYERAADWELPPDIRTIVERALTDERRHATYMDQVLRR